jgi:hypothetical protein
MAAATEEAKRAVLRRAEDEWDKVEGQKMQKRAEIYVKVGLEHFFSFVMLRRQRYRKYTRILKIYKRENICTTL